jgi:hypothetical protein
VPDYTFVDLTSGRRDLDREAVRAVLRSRDEPLDIPGDPSVSLRASVPWVKGLGWLNFIGNWHYWAEPPGDHADWVRAIAPSSAGKLEVWLTSLTPGQTYVLAIEVSCWGAGPNGAFRIGASDATGFAVDAQPPDQVLLVFFDPARPMSLVTVEPLDLESWTFHVATLFST